MARNWRTDGNPAFFVMLAAALLVGAFLRFHLFLDQVLIDDEWHGLYYAMDKSPGQLLTHFAIPGATCIPLNFYTWLLGVTVGWSEFWLRLPSILCGILCIVVGPMFARKLVGRRRAALLACLLAISPILIFYSRNSRPYSPVAFLGFLALLLGILWIQTGEWRYGVCYALVGIVAVYFHLFAAVVVGTPALAGVAMRLYSQFWKKNDTAILGPPWEQLLRVIGGMTIAGVTLILPALVRSMMSTMSEVTLFGSFQLQSLPYVGKLICGTAQPVLALLFWVLFVLGAVEQLRRNAWFGGILLSLYPLHALAMLVLKPDAVQSPIVLTRYCIPLVPVSLMLAACGAIAIFDFLAGKLALRPSWWMIPAVTYPALMLFTGPLPPRTIAPNNFTNHGAFQHYYEPMDWSSSFRSGITLTSSNFNVIVHSNEISPFYLKLGESSASRPLVEYPFMLGDQLNVYYFYQHFHHRPMIMGYESDVHLDTGLASGAVCEFTYIDQVLSLAKDQSKVKFRNFISMENLDEMRSRNAEYIVLHDHFEAELSRMAMPLVDLQRLRHQYREKLGPPCYEDANITVFRLDP